MRAYLCCEFSKLVEPGTSRDIVNGLLHFVNIPHSMVQPLQAIGEGQRVHIGIPSQVRTLHIQGALYLCPSAISFVTEL